MSSVDFILGGYERGGTTLLSELFRANGFESGFECGVLMVDEPRSMPSLQPYWDLLPEGWDIDDAVRQHAIQGDFQHFYETLCKEAFPEHKGRFFDKTPKYMETLGRCMSRAPFLKGAVIIHRDPRAVFVSMSKRLSPELPAKEAIEKNFDLLKKRYLSYFIGSIAHVENPQVLFVPFEELVSREDAWLKVLGYFTTGIPFVTRKSNSRFVNVTSEKMDLGKVVEFDRLLPVDLQERILDATQLASPFFASPVERVRYGDLWARTLGLAKERLHAFGLAPLAVDVEGTYFEPLTYLIRYPDVLNAGVDPVQHFQKNGRLEGRLPA